MKPHTNSLPRYNTLSHTLRYYLGNAKLFITNSIKIYDGVFWRITYTKQVINIAKAKGKFQESLNNLFLYIIYIYIPRQQIQIISIYHLYFLNECLFTFNFDDIPNTCDDAVYLSRQSVLMSKWNAYCNGLFVALAHLRHFVPITMSSELVFDIDCYCYNILW